VSRDIVVQKKGPVGEFPAAFFLQNVLQSGSRRAKNLSEPRALLTKYYPADKIRKNEMGGTCGTYGVKWYGGET
jgi:hypothetical protein